MSKYLLKDMVQTKHNIKEITREGPVRNGIKKEHKIIEIETNYPKNKSRYMLWLVAVISIIFCFFAISFLFSKVEVKVDPKTEDLVLNENLSANKDSSNDLFFNLVVIPGEESGIVPATGEKEMSLKATGTVIVYNAFSSSPQTLSIDTRLEGSNGKIYKTQTKTVVPGMNNKGIPGSIEVKIYASVAGTEYNSSPLDFKIVGFKGTSKYLKIYARSKGEIIGGFKGKIPAVSDAEKTSALANLKTTLEAKLLQKATDQIPSGFVLFKDAIFLNTNENNVSFTAKENNLMITMKGTLYGFIFDEQKLTKKIAKDNIEKYDGSDIYISNIKNLIFTLANKDNISFGDIQNINFNLSGPAKIVWKLDINKFITDLLGKSKKDFNQVLFQYGNIDSATLIISPVWKRSIPDQSKKIKVIINYPK
ncbi:MAG: hypothetical protein WC870_02375 [Candidatus Paceibacterota bacterium]